MLIDRCGLRQIHLVVVGQEHTQQSPRLPRLHFLEHGGAHVNGGAGICLSVKCTSQHVQDTVDHILPVVHRTGSLGVPTPIKELDLEGQKET